MPSQRSLGRLAAFRRAVARNPPQPASHAPPPAPVQGGGSVLAGNGSSTIAQGVAFGTGSAIAHRAVDAVMGPRTIQHETVVSESASPTAAPMSGSFNSDACNIYSKDFQECVNIFGSDISKCQIYLDMLYECKRGSSCVCQQLWKRH